MNASDLIELVSNPDKYKAALKEMDDRKQALDATIALYGEATKIGDLKQAAELALDKARTDAEKLVADAEAQAKVRKDILDAEFAKAAKMQEEANRQTSVALASSKAAETAKAEADRLVKENKEMSLRLTKQADELSAKHQELDERLAKLRSVMA